MDEQLSTAERRALEAWIPIEPPPGFADRVLDARGAAPAADRLRDARELDPEHMTDRRARRDGRRLPIAAIVAGCVAIAAIVALVLTRRGPGEERSTPVVEPAARPPAPAPAPVASTGIRVESALPFEVRAPYATTWVAKDPGMREVAPGSALRFRGAPAQVTAWDTTLEIRSAAVVQIDAPTNFVLEAGRIIVHARALVSARVRGGSILLDGPGEAELVVTDGDAVIATVFGGVRVHGKYLEHVAAIGDVVLLEEDGGLLVTGVSPTEADVKVEPSTAITIHDPHPPTAVQFQIGATCPAGGIVELAAEGQDLDLQRGGRGRFANLLVEAGSWTYRVRCYGTGGLGGAVATGRIHVERAPGTRGLPRAQPAVNRLDADGRSYRIAYDSVIPTLELRAQGTGSRFRLHVVLDGTGVVFESSLPTILVPSSALRDGAYTFWFERDGVKDAVVTSLAIERDTSATQLRLDAPIDGGSWATDLTMRPIEVRGSAAPGWVLSIEGIPLPVDDQGRFAASVGPLTTRALALRAEHATRGLHYFLRRPREP